MCRVVINIGGEVFETTVGTLGRFPDTLLGNREKRTPYYCTTSRQYFFNRSRMFFDAILFFYQSRGLLSCPPGVAYHLFEEECRFYELPEEAIKRIKPKELQELDADDETKNDNYHKSITFRSKIWDLTQNPETSVFARLFSILSLLFMVMSVISSCVETLPALKAHSHVYEHSPWAINELFLNSFFLLELLLGISCAPNLRNFMKSTMTLVDIIAVVPYFIVLTVAKDQLQSVGFLRIVRLIRITKMFKLSKHCTRLKIVGNILLSCVHEFTTLLICLCIIVILAGSLIYYLEDGGTNGSGFTTIPMGMYWAVQTISTVGYGDVTPLTIGGMLFASAFMLFGAITMSIPVLSIVAKFEAEYDISKAPTDTRS